MAGLDWSKAEFIDTDVELLCFRRDCQHNLVHTKRMAGCNLKRIDIDENGCCMHYLPFDKTVRENRARAFEKLFSPGKIR